jgi:hypothetical protein
MKRNSWITFLAGFLVGAAVVVIAFLLWRDWARHWMNQRKELWLSLTSDDHNKFGIQFAFDESHKPMSLWMWGAEQHGLVFFKYDSHELTNEWRAKVERFKHLFPEGQFTDEAESPKQNTHD